jgi:hypothetical protein
MRSGPAVAPVPRQPNEGTGRWQKEEHVVPAGEVLRHEGEDSPDEGPAAATGDEPTQPEEGEGHPVGGQHLQVRDLVDAIGGEAVEEPGQEGGGCVPGQVPDEEEHAERRPEKRGEEDDVVGENDVAGAGVQGEGLKRLRRKVLGVGQGQRRGVEDPGVPEVANRSAGREVEQPLRVPSQDPAVEADPEIAGP